MVATSQIREFCSELVREYHPRRVILFGSYANGEPRSDSDVDFLIVMPFKGKGAAKGAEIIRRLRPSFGVDLVIRTPRQVRQRLASDDFFLKEVTTKGKVLYEAPDA